MRMSNIGASRPSFSVVSASSPCDAGSWVWPLGALPGVVSSFGNLRGITGPLCCPSVDHQQIVIELNEVVLFEHRLLVDQWRWHRIELERGRDLLADLRLDFSGVFRALCAFTRRRWISRRC